MFRQVRVPVAGHRREHELFRGRRWPALRIFRHGGGQKLAQQAGVPFLGEIPIDPRVAECGDAGDPIVHKYPDSPVAQSTATWRPR